MRNVYLCMLAGAIFCSLDLVGQPNATISPYLLDSFIEGSLYYKGKPPRVAQFNYHLVGQEIVMDFNEKKVPVNNFPNLDSVRIGDHLFCLKDGRSYELLIPGSVELLLDYRFTSQQEANEGLYGTKSHTQGVVVANKTLKRNDYYSLHWNEGYELVNRSEFYISENGTSSKFGNANQLGQIFKSKKKQIKEFSNQEKIDFAKSEDVIKIVRFILDN